VVMIISKIVVFQDNNLERTFFSKCLLMEMGVDLTWSSGRNLVVTSKQLGSCQMCPRLDDFHLPCVQSTLL
jgi:hypothetical protein